MNENYKSLPDAEYVRKRFGIFVHVFSLWKIGRYARLRNFKYLAYPFFLQRLVAQIHEATTLNTLGEIEIVNKERIAEIFPDLLNPKSLTGFDLIFSQHAIAA